MKSDLFAVVFLVNVLSLSVIEIVWDIHYHRLPHQYYAHAITVVNAFDVVSTVTVVPPSQRKQFPQRGYTGTHRSILIRHSTPTGMNSEMEEELTSSSSSSSFVSKKPPRLSSTGFSYVEDGVYTNIVEEIEAMGGDPSFLIETEPPSSPTLSSATITGSEMTVPASSDTAPPVPAVGWEWDGVEEEEAYFDE